MEHSRKEHLREVNLHIWEDFEDGIGGSSVSLDSSLKKNTAFIKRLRTSVNATSLSLFLQDIHSLSIQKYLSEVISAFCEGCLRLRTVDEFAVACEVASALHQRFGPDAFTRTYASLLRRALGVGERPVSKQALLEQKDRDEKERIGRQRTLLRLVTDLWLVGVLRTIEDALVGDEPPQPRPTRNGSTPLRSVPKRALGAPVVRDTQADPFPLAVLKELLDQDRGHSNLPLAVFFAKTFATQILGVENVKPSAESILGSDGSQPLGEMTETTVDEVEVQYIPQALQIRFRNVLTNYFDRLVSTIIRGHAALNDQARRNAEVAVKTGQLFEDRQENYDKQQKEQERLIGGGQIVSEILGTAMPVLSQTAEEQLADISIGLVKKGDYLAKSDGPGIWEDEEERKFYENLIDLKERVPGILLEDPKKKQIEETVTSGTRPKSAHSAEGDLLTQEASARSGEQTRIRAESAEIDPQTAAIVNRTTGSQVDSLLPRLPELMNKEAVDQFAIDFCFLNSKASRNRLVKALQEVPKGRVDLLPLYARLATTLGRYLTDILENMINYLHNEFRSLQRRKEKDFLGQVRMSNVRYLAEFVKFGMVPDHVTFHCLKVSLDDFSRMNIELMAVLLENCGRYLLRNQETGTKMGVFMETLQRKKGSHHMGQQERMLVENTIFFVNPPERAAIEQKERSPIELFVHKLVYEDMNKNNYSRIFKLLRKLHWEEAEIWTMALKVFTRPWKIKYSDTYLLAILVSSLHRYHPDLSIEVIDDTMEQIVGGLELNSFSHNQRRVSQVRYLGELYIYKIVDSTLVFETLNRLVTFGHDNGVPDVEGRSEVDPPNDFFRIQLICNLLQVSGNCFGRGPASKRLDDFIILFQYYILTKDSMPIDIDFLLQDTMAPLRPSWKMPVSLEEATRLLRQTFAQTQERPMSSKSEPEEMQMHSDSSGSEVDDDEDTAIKPAPRTGSIAQEDQYLHGNGHIGSSDEDEHLIVRREEIARDPAEEQDFDRELAQMMSSSLDQRKFERRPIFDMPLPIKKRVATGGSGSDSDSGRGTPPHTVAFSLMTKKGNRQQTKSIELPSNSAFAVAMRDRQLAERAEQQRIKSLVLNYDLG